MENMKTNRIKKEERIDIRVSPEDKEIFIRAQRLSGEKTFSAFVTRVVRNRSFEIISENDRILASERDRKIFFEAIFSNKKPNKALKEAADKSI
jgi:uncharacterized protein (DUF1778 family)